MCRSDGLVATMLCRSVTADRRLAATGTAPSCVLSVALYAMQTCAASVRSLDCFRTRKKGPTTTGLLISMLHHQTHVKALEQASDVTFVSCFTEARELSPLLLASARAAGHASTLAESRKTTERRTDKSCSG
jgi:hypothetical protein